MSEEVIFRKINYINDLEELRELWIRLSGGNDMTFFQSYEWNSLLYDQWRKTICSRITEEIVVAYNDKIIAPLIVNKAGISYKGIGLKRGLYFLGMGSYSDYMNLIYDEVCDEEIKEFINAILKRYKNMNFFMYYLKNNTLLSKLINEERKFAKEISVAVNVNIDSKTYYESLSKSTRQNIRTAMNRINRDNLDYSYKVKRGILDEDTVNRLISMHTARVYNKNSMGSRDLFSFINRIRVDHTEKNNNIIRNAMLKCENGISVIVYLNSEIIGYLYGFVDGSSIRIVHNCFDERFKFYSPVFRATYDFLAECCDDNDIIEVDFTRGNEEYKYKLGGLETELSCIKLRGGL